MKIVKIEAEYIVKLDFIKMLNKLIKEIESTDTFTELTTEIESNFGGKLTAKIKNTELVDLRQKS